MLHKFKTFQNYDLNTVFVVAVVAVVVVVVVGVHHPLGSLPQPG